MPSWEARFSTLLGEAALRLSPDLPKDVQERKFEPAAPLQDLDMRNRLAIYLHEHLPRTAHLPKSSTCDAFRMSCRNTQPKSEFSSQGHARS